MPTAEHHPDAREHYVTRDAILKKLSDEEIAKVSAAEARPIVEGDDYIDLEHPENGVLKGKGAPAPRPGGLLPRSAVREETWAAIVTLVGK
jgi:hypothetical protein